MLQKSFCFLDKIGPTREQRLWESGIQDWNDFLAADKVKGMSGAYKKANDHMLNVAKMHLKHENAAWFGAAIPSGEQWRLYNEFKDEAVYLDIETSGYYGDITVIGLYDNYDTKTFVRGINLDRKLVQQAMEKYKMVVTFNGASFDLPVIRRYFDLEFDMPHVDLRFVCQKVGLTGGLKAIERRLGIARAEEVDGICGEDAVNLWHMYKTTGKREFLDLLVQYNEEDIINLPILAHKTIPVLWNKVRNMQSIAARTWP